MMFQSLLLFLLLSYVNGNDVSNCGGKEVALSYLDEALYMITKAESNIRDNNDGPVDCAEILLMGQNNSGVYNLRPMNRITDGKVLKVYCDMDTDGGGWTIIQRRGDFKRPADYFFKDWKSYKEGFGDVDKDYWLGNDNIFALTNQKQYTARFDLKDVEGNKKYASYNSFWVDNELNKYTLHITDYSGDAGDSMDVHNNVPFSTKDQKNGVQKEDNCAQKYKGGWWYQACHRANLNGLYLKGKHASFADGVEWYTWTGHYYSLESTEIKIRPKKFRPPTPLSCI